MHPMLNNYLKRITMNKKSKAIFRQISFLTSCLVLFACDPSYTTTFYYKNNTTDSILLYLYANNKIDNDTVILQPQIKETIFKKNIFGGPALLSYDLFDSITISKRDKKIIFNKGDQELNSIYNLDNWELKKKGKYDYEYTYSFTENDFK